MIELPRLLFCCFDVVPAPHGTSRRLSEYLECLSEHFQVVALTVKTPMHAHIERYRGARLLRVPVGTGDLRSRIETYDRAVRRQLESEEYLLVHFFDPISGFPLCERRSEFGYRVVYDACRFPATELPSFITQEGTATKALVARARRQELFCLLNADAVLAGSEVAKEHWAGLGTARERLHTVRPPVSVGEFAQATSAAPRGVPVRLVHLNSGQQDLSILVEALKRTTSGARLLLAGPPDPWHPIKERVRECGLSERVVYRESLAHAEIPGLLANTDVGLIVLSDVERDRNSALARASEYLAAGRALVAADLPVTRELLPTGATRFYRPGDAQGLAEAIDELATSPERRAHMGAQARQFASAVDTKTVRDRLLAVYRQIAPSVRTGQTGKQAQLLKGASPDELTSLAASPDAQPTNLRPSPEESTAIRPVEESHRPWERPPQITVNQRTPITPHLQLPTPEFTDPHFSQLSSGLLEQQTGPEMARQKIADPLPTVPLAGSTLPAAPPPALLVGDDEPLDLSAMLKPAIASPAKSRVTPVPVQVPASFSLAASPSGLRTQANAPQTGPPPLPARPPAQASQSAIQSRPAEPGATSPSLSRPSQIQGRPASGSSGIQPAPRSLQAGSHEGAAAPAPPNRGAPHPHGAQLAPPPGRDSASDKGEPSSLDALPDDGSDVPHVDDVELVEEAEQVDSEVDGASPWTDDGASEIDAEELEALETRAAPPDSDLDPWFAQLVHGYCPPESLLFTRHVPPTTTPGRDS